MKNIIVETSIASFIYSRGDNYHHSTPGDFEVFDKIREETYWQMSCYDGGEGFGNKKENVVQKLGMERFLLLNEKCKKLQTDFDKAILEEIVKPVSIEIKNPKYFGSLF
jgi:hypothetical protein